MGGPGSIVRNSLRAAPAGATPDASGFARYKHCLDLAATDILRNRERGVPRYNEFRRKFHMAPCDRFDDFSADPQVVAVALDDCLVAYRMNGEMLRPENVAMLNSNRRRPADDLGQFLGGLALLITGLTWLAFLQVLVGLGELLAGVFQLTLNVLRGLRLRLGERGRQLGGLCDPAFERRGDESVARGIGLWRDGERIRASVSA